MKAKEYLEQIRWSSLKIKQKQEQIRKLERAAGETGIDLAAPYVKRSDKSDIGDLIAEYEDLKKEIASDMLKHQKTIDEVIRTIQSASKPLYAEILYQKWVEGLTLEQIAVKMNYNFYYIRNAYVSALKEMGKKINK